MVNTGTSRASLSQVNKHFTHSAKTYHCGAQLQKQVGKKLLSLLPESTGMTLDLGCGPGLFSQELKQRSSNLVSLDLSPEMLKQHQVGSLKVNSDSHALPFLDSVFDNVFSSLMVQWCDLSTVFNEAYRVLKPGGKAAFSTLVSGTLNELQRAWGELDSDQHIHQYLSHADVTSALEQLSCSSLNYLPSEMILHFDSVYLLAKELKQLGANYVKGRRNKGLITKAKWQQLEQAYFSLFGDENRRIPATYQVLYIEMTK